MKPQFGFPFPIPTQGLPEMPGSPAALRGEEQQDGAFPQLVPGLSDALRGTPSALLLPVVPGTRSSPRGVWDLNVGSSAPAPMCSLWAALPPLAKVDGALV